MMKEYIFFFNYPFKMFFNVITLHSKCALMLGVLIQVTLNTTKLKLMKNLQFAIYGRTIRQHSP